MEGKVFSGQKLILVMLLLGHLHGFSSCIEKERKALLELKKFVMSRCEECEYDSVLPTWTNDTKSDCCQWENIKCNRTSRRLTGLSLYTSYYLEISLLNLSLLHPFEEVRSLDLSNSRLNGLVDDVEGITSCFSQCLFLTYYGLHLETFFPAIKKV